MWYFKFLLTPFIFLFFVNIGFSQAFDLGSATSFSVFTAVGTFSNEGASSLAGNIGTNAGSLKGFPPGIVVGSRNVANELSATASDDVGKAYHKVAATACGVSLGTSLGNGQSLTPNVYCLGSTSILSGTLTLNGQGNPNALFIFKIDGALSTSTSANVVLTNGASICNVYWQVGGAFNLGGNACFRGNVLVCGAIKLNKNSLLYGRALTIAGAVNLYTTTVEMPSPPSVSISAGSSTSLCTGQSVTLKASIANSYSWTNGSTSQSITVSTAGSYAVTVTNACGTATSAATKVTSIPSPNARIFAMGPLTFCPGGSVTLNAAGGYSYLWSNGATSPSIKVTAGGSYTVTATIAGGCTDTSAATIVTVNSIPASIVASGATTFCQGGSVVLMASAGASYLWSNGVVTQKNTVVTSGIHSVTVTNASSCKSTSQATTVKVLPIIIPTITAQRPLSFCIGDSVVLTSSAANGYLWNNGATTQSITVTTSGNYSVATTGECGSGSTATTSMATVVQVNAGPNPTILASGPLTFCPGGNVILTSSPASSYLWSNGATTRSITVTAAGNYSVTSGECAGASAIVRVITNALVIPTISANGPLTLCPGEQVILTASAANGYLWNTGATTQSISAKAAGNYSVMTSNACGIFSAATSMTVTNIKPTITSDGPLTLCVGGSVKLTASEAAGYLWSNGATTRSIIAVDSGLYTVKVAGNCAVISAPVSVSMIGTGAPTITSSASVLCTGDSTVLTSSLGSGYLWSTGDTTRSIIVKVSGSYSVITSGECGDTSAALLIAVTTAIPVSITASGPTSFCIGESVTLTASKGNSYFWSIGGKMQSIQVNQGGDYWVIVDNGCGIKTSPLIKVVVTPYPVCSIVATSPQCEVSSTRLCAASANVTYRWSTGDTSRCITISQIGTYSVTVTNASECSSTCSKTINASQAPACTISNEVNICPTQSSVLSAPSGNVSYLWNTGATSQNIALKDSGIYTVTVTNLNGCVSTCSKKVALTASAECLIMGDLSICNGGTTELSAPMGFKSYLWSNGSTEAWVTVADSGVYTVIVTNSNGCMSKCSQRVTMEDCGVVCLPGYQKTVPNFQAILAQQKAIDLRPKDIDVHVVPHVAVQRAGAENFEAIAYPNPFTQYTTINFTANKNNDRWKVEVFNLQGQKVASLFDDLITANKRIQLRFDAADLLGGIYFYRINNGISTWSNRLILNND